MHKINRKDKSIWSSYDFLLIIKIWFRKLWYFILALEKILKIPSHGINSPMRNTIKRHNCCHKLSDNRNFSPTQELGLQTQSIKEFNDLSFLFKEEALEKKIMK
ncbi:hypothetical protein BpHYR1_045657 [Brachionus plicatilis]|uniref:Uncharacterized protein n=1 Tax=Brachionus plicatilis TaxID=10195 RepID=A0A3M7PJU2_BRAPC|nr:hypothetical protein BpHYR1_045657 [Brachionus plicatilis]